MTRDAMLTELAARAWLKEDHAVRSMTCDVMLTGLAARAWLIPWPQSDQWHVTRCSQGLQLEPG